VRLLFFAKEAPHTNKENPKAQFSKRSSVFQKSLPCLIHPIGRRELFVLLLCPKYYNGSKALCQ